MANSKILKGHFYMACAAIMWGLMAPLGKDAMMHGISGFNMVGLRVTGASICFWLASCLAKMVEKGEVCKEGEESEEGKECIGSKESKEGREGRVPMSRHEYLCLFGAALFAIVFNQCNYIVGLSITSPLNASIMTTTMPIITMVLAALILKDKITSRGLFGVLLGACGAATLIIASSSGRSEGGVLLGDLMCIGGQFSYAIYLTAFRGVISRHPVITCQKWMMTFAALLVMPLALPGLIQITWSQLSMTTYLETAFVVVGGTFLSFLCCTKAQQILRPTIIAMYNYVQPIVACTASVLLGLGVFGWIHLLAVILVFTGVYLVNRK